MISYEQLCEALDRYNARMRNAAASEQLEHQVSVDDVLETGADYSEEYDTSAIGGQGAGDDVDDESPGTDEVLAVSDAYDQLD